jgi:ABC-2 type transport system permease protein
MIDGFRYGFHGVSDVAPLASLGISVVFLAVLSAVTLVVLRSGYRLRH